LVENGLATTNVIDIESGDDKNVQHEVVDNTTNKVIGTLDGVFARSLTVSPDGTRLYATNIDGVSVISTATVTPIV
jgi:DNA-binding beta-propeller fold protein YncE